MANSGRCDGCGSNVSRGLCVYTNESTLIRVSLCGKCRKDPLAIKMKERKLAQANDEGRARWKKQGGAPRSTRERQRRRIVKQLNA